jgi:hypothetical protein
VAATMTCRPGSHFAAFVLAAGLTEHQISEMARKNGLPVCSSVLSNRRAAYRPTASPGAAPRTSESFPRTEYQPAAQCGVSPAVNRERKGFHIRLARVDDTGLIG